MNDYSIFDRNGIPRPPVFSGMTGQGADAMYSVGGRWMKAGQTTANGYLINSYDPNSYTLGMTYKGVPVPVQMQTSIIPPYTPQFIKEANGGAGGISEQDLKRMEDMNKALGMANSYLNDPSFEIPEGFSFDKSAVEQFKNNYFSNKERKKRNDLVDIVPLEQFREIASSPDAQSGLYYVPYQDNDGNVDFHEFYMEGQQRVEPVIAVDEEGNQHTIKIPYADR